VSRSHCIKGIGLKMDLGIHEQIGHEFDDPLGLIPVFCIVFY